MPAHNERSSHPIQWMSILSCKNETPPLVELVYVTFKEHKCNSDVECHVFGLRHAYGSISEWTSLWFHNTLLSAFLCFKTLGNSRTVDMLLRKMAGKCDEQQHDDKSDFLVCIRRSQTEWLVSVKREISVSAGSESLRSAYAPLDVMLVYHSAPSEKTRPVTHIRAFSLGFISAAVAELCQIVPVITWQQ